MRMQQAQPVSSRQVAVLLQSLEQGWGPAALSRRLGTATPAALSLLNSFLRSLPAISAWQQQVATSLTQPMFMLQHGSLAPTIWLWSFANFNLITKPVACSACKNAKLRACLYRSQGACRRLAMFGQLEDAASTSRALPPWQPRYNPLPHA